MLRLARASKTFNPPYVSTSRQNHSPVQILNSHSQQQYQYQLPEISPALNSMYYFINYTPCAYAFPLHHTDYFVNSLSSEEQPTTTLIPSTQVFQEARSQDLSQSSTSVKETIAPPIFAELSREKAPKSKPIQTKKLTNDSFTQKRNIIPNNINHILAFVQRKSKSESIVERAILQHKQPGDFYTIKQFYCYQHYLKGKIHIHVNKKTLEIVTSHLDLHSSIFSIEEQLFYNRICRVVIYYYLRNTASLTTLNSRRLRETCKSDHLKAQRCLVRFMRGCNEEK